MNWVRAITVAVAGLTLGAVTACGAQDDGVSGAPVADQRVQPQADAQVPLAKQAAVTKKLAVANVDPLGQIVVDGDGMSVYRFDNDTAKPPKSTCVADCAVAWPPLLTTDAAAIEIAGIDKALIGAVARDDGGQQVTIAGWPAYRFAKDTNPGEAKGQGAGGKWFAFTPVGKKAANLNAPPSVQLVLMKVGNLGQIITDSAGMTLYRFDKDTKGEKSACEGACATQWPPVIVADGVEVQTTGVDKANVGAITRADGSKQVTVGGWPLYHFAGDKAPCDTNGQGVGGVWFATTATGARAGR
jgi:predicted lipoprotein with Yx(FWY)xxD motif